MTMVRRFHADMVSDHESGALVSYRDYDALAAKVDEAQKAAVTLSLKLGSAEAALRDLVDYADITKHVDADAVTARVKRAREVLGLTAETTGEV
jgi:hypothetical protein